MWPQPQLERAPWHPLPVVGRLFGSRVVDVLCGAVGVALLVILIVAGYVGPDSASDNLVPTFIMITFWVGLVVLSLLFGDVFRAFNPWRAIGRAVGAVVGRRGPARRPYPEQLGRWPAAAGLLFFTWIELIGGWADTPATLTNAIVGYTVVTLAAQSVWGVETWTRRGEAFSVYFNLFSRVSPLETRDRVLGYRRPLAGLPKLDPVPGTVAMVMVMIGTVTFDGLSQGDLWGSAGPWLADAFETVGATVTAAPKLADTIGLLAGVGFVAGFYWLGMEGARSVGGGIPADAAAAGLRPLAGADRRRLRAGALPHVPDLRGPGDPVPGLGPVRPGLGPVRPRVGGDRLLAAQPTTSRGTCSSASWSPATSRR